ncbi:hypothetical protein [Neobacillus sp. YIM B06451]|uniref:hypothetical protein n=1 Tax=Neobacillus sp. YIM B06451 TaxID=3070994 RepID=UPI00292FFAC1|nr:hypothetical protein [Neobacillus sp. YIM B06451]
MKKILSGLVAGALAIGVLAGSAFAAVTFDSATGTGFVGKGDVQTALGLNNAEMQKIAKELEFTYAEETVYAVEVYWTTGEGTRGEKTHYVTHKKTQSIKADIDYMARNQKQVNGFILKEMKITDIENPEIPAVGDVYPGNSGHIVTSVEEVSTTGGLYVNGVLLQ